VTTRRTYFNLFGKALLFDLFLDRFSDRSSAMGPTTGHADIYDSFSFIGAGKDFIAEPFQLSDRMKLFHYF